MDRERLQQLLGHLFSQPELLTRALTHRSHGARHNERLEFLGDSVLNCVIATELYRRFPKLKEGELSRIRANLVCQESLHQIALGLALGDYLMLGEGELKSGGFARPSILADTVEAVVGAVYLDGGFEAAQKVIGRFYAGTIDGLDPKDPGKDAKTRLQEWLQSRRLSLPQYSVVSTQGAAHSQRFEVECLVPDRAVRTRGFGASRRTAEQEAALHAFEQLIK